MLPRDARRSPIRSVCAVVARQHNADEREYVRLTVPRTDPSGSATRYLIVPAERPTCSAGATEPA
jgi:hypothetical protein